MPKMRNGIVAFAAAGVLVLASSVVASAQTPAPSPSPLPTAASSGTFRPPTVSVIASSLAPGAHADLQTTIDTPSGLMFDQVAVFSPPGSSVASDAQITDGTIVGRLDSDSTTNAITGAACDVRVSFSVPIRKETADVSAANYPGYLRTILPGPHRLRLVADVSPSPQIPIFVNYLFDIDPLTNGVVLHTVVGDPTSPSPLQTCTPERSTNTLFGVTPSGVPLFTSPSTPPPRVLTFVFTSRPDAQGMRHTQTVRTTATAGNVAFLPLTEPTPAVTPQPIRELEPPLAISARPVVGPSTGTGDGTRADGPADQDGFALVLACMGVVLTGAGICLRRRLQRRS